MAEKTLNSSECGVAATDPNVWVFIWSGGEIGGPEAKGVGDRWYPLFQPWALIEDFALINSRKLVASVGKTIEMERVVTDGKWKMESALWYEGDVELKKDKLFYSMQIDFINN